MALCEKTRCPLILNMVSVDISMVKICLVNKFMVISSLHTGCPAKRVHFFIFYQPKLIQIQSLEVLQKRIFFYIRYNFDLNYLSIVKLRQR